MYLIMSLWEQFTVQVTLGHMTIRLWQGVGQGRVWMGVGGGTCHTHAKSMVRSIPFSEIFGVIYFQQVVRSSIMF
jgi:hypothetical protein